MTSVASTPIVYTPAVITDQMLSDITTDESQQAALQVQLASGNVINSPSDDPAGAAQVLQLGSGIARAAQYQSNATDGLGWLSLGNSTMNSIISTLQSAQQAVESLSGSALSGNSTSLQGIADEVTSAQTQLLNLANTTYNGQAIFAGTGSTSQAYDAGGNYLGGGSAPARTVGPGTQVPVSVTGPSVFGSGASGLLGPGGILSQIANDITAGTSSSLQSAETTGLQALNGALSQAESQAAELGGNYQQMVAASQQATDASTALQSQLSGVDSTDVAQVSTQLTEAQQSFQSGLWAISQIQEDSLVQYLG